MELIKTDIPRLDELLGGGLQPSSFTVFWSHPGIAGAPFAYHLLNNRLSAGDSATYLVQTKRTDTVLNEIEKYGWEVQNFKNGNLKFIDAYSNLISAPSKEKLVVKDPKDINQITKTLKKTLNKLNGKHKLVVVDSLCSLIDNCGEGVLDQLITWKKIFREKNATGIFLFTEWPYEKRIFERIDEVSDAIIKLKAIEEKVILREYFTVTKINWGKPAKKGVPFKVTHPGGVHVYVPKVLVTGPFNAGKTSFVHSASTKAVSVDRAGTTVALDHGHVDYGGFAVDLFGTPGQDRFDPVIELLGGEALGIIVVVDSTASETFPRAKEMMEKSRTVGLPYVIAANKADMSRALKPKEIKKFMELPEDIPIIPVMAENLKEVKEGVPCKLRQEDVHAVLDALFRRIV